VSASFGLERDRLMFFESMPLDCAGYLESRVIQLGADGMKNSIAVRAIDRGIECGVQRYRLHAAGEREVWNIGDSLDFDPIQPPLIFSVRGQSSRDSVENAEVGIAEGVRPGDRSLAGVFALPRA